MAEAMDYKLLFNHNPNNRKILNMVPVGISVMDSGMNIVVANNSFARVIGVTRKDIINQHHKKLRYLGQNGAEMSLSELSDSLLAYKGKIIKDVVIGIINEKNKIRWVEVTAAPADKAGGFLVLIVNDVTKKTHLQKKLADSELKLRSLYENSLDAILLTCTDGEILTANPAACRMLQMTEREICLKGRNGVVDINDPHLGEGLKIRSEKGKFHGEINMIRGNGEVFPAEISTSVFISKDGKPLSSIIIRDISERKKSETQLNKMKDKLRGLSWHLQEAIETERRQISMDLHDDLGQKLTALKLYCSSLQPKLKENSPEFEERMNEITSIFKETLATINKISYRLRPGILDDLGIIAAINWHIAEFSRATGIICKMTFNPKEITLNNRISLVVFRTIQESLTNIIKHSKATRVSIRMTLNSTSLILAVRDNGIGIDFEKINNTKSFGISGMKERVESVGGELKISGAINKGTQILVIIPVNNEEFK